MTYLTSADATLANAYRYFADLASDELDFDGVPLSFQTIDIVVAEPTEAAIKAEIAKCDWLKGYTLVNFWKPEPYSPF